MALAFMHTLNSTINYTFQESNREFDNMGVDLWISSFLVGQSRSVASGSNEIMVQLKGVAESSASMFQEDDESVTYTLKDDLLQIGMNMYLFVVVLPSDESLATWREVNDMDILLRARGYYMKVDGTLHSGKIRIPKGQQLTPDTYQALFTQAAEEMLA